MTLDLHPFLEVQELRFSHWTYSFHT